MHVQWTRPTFWTFGYLSVLWGLCAGIVLGVGGFLESLFGVETKVGFVVWQFQGITAGVIGILVAPCSLRCSAPCRYSCFRSFGSARRRPRALDSIFKWKATSRCASRLQLRSYLRLSAIFGALVILFSTMLLGIGVGTSKCDDIGVPVVPGLFTVWLARHGAAAVILALLAAPFLYATYSAAIGIVAFIPFRLLTWMTRSVLPCIEVLGGNKTPAPERSKIRRFTWRVTLLALCAVMLLLCLAILGAGMSPSELKTVERVERMQPNGPTVRQHLKMETQRPPLGPTPAQ